MKKIQNIDVSAKNTDLVSDFGMPDYSPREYPCQRCGRMLKLKKVRVLYCGFCHKGFLHPKYDFQKDAIL